jgi:Predicted aminopeptidases
MKRLLVLSLVLAVLSCTLLAQPPSADNYGAKVAASLDQAKVLEHARTLSALGSRVVGYPGYYQAAHYITRRLEELGYSVEVQEFAVVAPVETEAYVEVGGEKLKVHAVWPNAMFVPPSTPPEGISGKLVYVGGGDARDMDGKEMEGSIVLMDFDSGDNWLRAADLGAKAVVFLEPEDTNSLQALAKFTSAPVHFVRVYATKDTAARLLELQGRVARLVVRVEVKEVKAYNILVIVNGTSYPNEAIFVAAYYDSGSIVPAVSPGFIEALSPSLLLELDRVLKAEPPTRSVWLAFLSGFHKGLAGPRAFVERYFYSPEVARGTLKLWMMVGIQLTDESPRVSSTFVGFGLRYGAGSSAIAGQVHVG